MIVERIIRKLLSYTRSHIYDIHAVVVSLLVLVVVFFIQKKLHSVIIQYIDKYLEKKPDMQKKRDVYIRRISLIYIVLIFLLSNVFFALVALISPFVVFSFPSAVMGMVYTIFEYAILRQIMWNKVIQLKGENE